MIKQQTMYENFRDRYLKESEASEITGLSKAWFQRARVYGGGPPFIKLSHGKAIRYSEIELRNWIDAQKCNSTSEYSSNNE